jgi:hypothetical protein
MTIDIVCSLYVFIPRVRVFMVSTNKVFPCVISSDIRVWSNSST